jgi:hypothetical protein
VALGLRFGRETRGIELQRVVPQMPVPMHEIDRDGDGRAFAQLDIVEPDGADRPPHQQGSRRIKPHRLLKHRIEQREFPDLPAADRAAAGDAEYFLAHLLLPLGKQREQVKRPGQCL